MAEENDRVVRSVAWSELCPWLSLFRTLRLAIGFRVLLLSAAGVFTMTLGWWLIATIFSGTEDSRLKKQWIDRFVAEESGEEGPSLEGYLNEELDEDLENLSEPSQRGVGCPWLDAAKTGPEPLGWSETFESGGGRIVGKVLSGDDPFLFSWRRLGEPFLNVFGLLRTESKWTGLLLFTLSGLWALVVWAFFGGAITRIVALRLARNESIGWGATIRHVRTKWLAYVAGPAFPLVGVAFIAFGLLIAGFVMSWGGFFVFVFSLIWPLFLLAGLLMAILLLGLLFGWPLMWPTVGVESTDSFDALSRSYAYVFQRPLHYLFYAVVVALLGVLGWLLVANFAEAVIALTYGAVQWGGGAELWEPGAGTAVIHFWVGCVRLLALGFVFSFFWTGATAIYFLLRRDVDATEMDEIFLDEEEEEFPEGLPEVTTDEAGGPRVAEETTGEQPPPSEQPGGQEPESPSGPEGESPDD